MTVSFFSVHQTPPRWDTASIADTVLRGRNTKSEDGRRDERLHLPFLAHTLILPEKQLRLKHHTCRQSSYDEEKKEKGLRDVGTRWKRGIISRSKGRNLSHLARGRGKKGGQLAGATSNTPHPHTLSHTLSHTHIHTHSHTSLMENTVGHTR